MRKAFFYVSLMLVALWSCTKETDVTPKETPQESSQGSGKGKYVATLSVGVESDATKGVFDNNGKFQWQAGDQIGVYLYSSTLDNVPGAYNNPNQYGPWIAPFDIQSGVGGSSASFSRELNGDLGETYGNVAIYPYTSGSSFAYDSNTGGTLTFNLPAKYENLDNLDMVRMPMVAVINKNEDGLELKHVGGAVKFTLKNVPSKAKYFKLWAVDKNISGDYTITLNSVGSGGTLQGSGSANTVELQLKQGQATASLDVYFPIPAGENYQFGIGVYGDGIVYLEKTSTKTKTVGRGQILVMPAVDITQNLGPYNENLASENKQSGITYQMNVYSFADSDGDGIGDFPGIVNHLDYLDKLGVTAIWLSPSQLAQSYHGYDIKDYTLLNPLYAGGGTANHTSAAAETAFQNLINAAHARNIRIYMDYVINHTGDQHPWFLDVKEKGPSSAYWNYYAVSANPYDDVHQDKIPQIPTSWDVDYMHDSRWWPFVYGAGQTAVRYAIDLDWTNASSPVISVSDGTGQTLTASDGNATYNNASRYLFWGNGTYTQFADNGTSKYRLVLDYQSDWGCLVRTTNNNDDWSDGTKWGFASGKDQLQLGGAGHALTATDSNNILMPDGTLYYYYSAFSTGMMPDLNYYHSNVCETSPAFQAIVATVDKWLDMGLDGLRLDAIKHIYGNESGGAGSENREFWQKFYNAVNTKYQAKTSKRSNLNGTSDTNIFMVGEVLSGASDCLPFYGCLPAIFDFQFWWDLREVLKNDSKGSFVTDLQQRYRWDIYGVNSNAILTPKLSNHDEDRTASVLYDMHRIRQAAAVLLTVPGRPFIYQGEELGYWGEASMGGDEYRRAPILWTTDISSAALEGVFNKVPEGMLTPERSVVSQAADDESLLTLYRRFAYARNTNPAMANAWIEADSKTADNTSVMAWYMHEVNGSKTCLVMHNISNTTQSVQRWDGDNVSDATILVASDPIQFSNENGKWVIMPPYSSVVFALN